MSAHDHTEYVEGCFRCDLSRNEPLTTEENLPRRRTEAEARRCSQEGCPGDGRYQPPGKGHLPGCQHNAVAWAWETVAPDDATCLRCEASIHLDDRGVWRSLIGEAACYRNPARDGHEPRVPSPAAGRDESPAQPEG